jgi:GNAT superfamily N-acetyltransferase
VNCFYVRRGWRRKGLTSALLEAAVAHARANGAQIVEGYPKESGTSGEAFTGFLSQFERAGFKEVARRSARQPIVRRVTDEVDSVRHRD